MRPEPAGEAREAAASEPVSRRVGAGAGTHILDWGGDGRPLMLLHGMAGNAWWWEACAPRLAPGLRAVALDLRGHGDSRPSPEGSYGVEAFLEDIEEARRALGWEAMSLAGHSLGGRLALAYAAERPERVLRLAAVDFLPEFRREASAKFLRIRGRPQPLYPSQEEALRRFRLEPSGTLLGPDALLALGRRCVRHTEAGWTWKFDWKCLGLSYDPVWPWLPSVRTATLVVRGALSPVMTRDDLGRVASLIPDCRAVELARAHHHVPLDLPAELASLLAPFLAS